MRAIDDYTLTQAQRLKSKPLNVHVSPYCVFHANVQFITCHLVWYRASSTPAQKNEEDDGSEDIVLGVV